MSINFRPKTIQIIIQRGTFCSQGNPESGCVRKESVDIDILIKSRKVKKLCNLLE